MWNIIIPINKPVKYTHIIFSSYYELSRTSTRQRWKRGVGVFHWGRQINKELYEAVPTSKSWNLKVALGGNARLPDKVGLVVSGSDAGIFAAASSSLDSWYSYLNGTAI